MKKQLIYIFSLLLSILISAGAFMLQKHVQDGIIQKRFDEKIDFVTSEINSEMSSYQKLSINLKAFVQSSTEVSREEWENYYEILESDKYYPGTSSILFIENVEKSELENFIQEVRNDKSLNGVGYPNFAVRPEDETAEEYLVVKYISPADESRLGGLGFNVFSESIRKSAVDKSLQTNSPVATEKITFSLSEEPGFILYHTVPDENNNIKYALAITFRANELFEFIASKVSAQDDVNIQIYDGDSLNQKDLYFEKNSIENPELSKANTIHFGDKLWTLKISSKISLLNLTWRDMIFPYVGTLIIFICISTLQVVFLRKFINEKEVNLSIENYKDKLKTMEDKFNTVFNNTDYSILLIDSTGKIIETNNIFRNNFIKASEKVNSQLLWEITPLRSHINQSKLEKKFKLCLTGTTQKFNIVLKTGKEESKYEATMAPIFDNSGETQTVILQIE